ncbi:hypothetical protein A2U01_0035618, partial [Trifolium medium]|nr:hypothetical protein [Trifolium medium]
MDGGDEWVVATDLRWGGCGCDGSEGGGGGGCDGSEMEVMRGVVDIFESLMVSKSAEICRFLCIWLTFRVGVDCLEADCEPGLIYLGFQSTVAPSIFGSRSCFLDSDGPITFNSRSGVRVQRHLYGS